jgi:hypothetical protein
VSLDFVILGAQKCGTTALARFLDQHPCIAMSRPKEAHVFDREHFALADVDRVYAQCFNHALIGQLRGEATPVYLYFPDVPARLHQYNPNLKMIVCLRDPVARAISHHAMEYGRGDETLPLWRALLAESARLKRDVAPERIDSASRHHSYRSRGYYTRQIEQVLRYFPRHQLLLIRSEDLMQQHDKTLRLVFEFLGVDPDVVIPHEIIFSGTSSRPKHALVQALLSLSYLAENRRLRKLLNIVAN